MKLPEFKSAISQFQQECLQRSQEKKNQQIRLNEVPESKACSTTCQPWLYFESHICFLSPRTLSLIHVKGRLKEPIKKKRNHEEWDKIEI